MKIHLLLLVILAACGDWSTEPNSIYVISPNEITREGYNRAVRCIIDNNYRVIFHEKDIDLYIVPGTSFIDNTGAEVIGFSYKKNNIPSIFISEHAQQYIWLWEHEYVHSIANISGHPLIFCNCKLLPNVSGCGPEI